MLQYRLRWARSYLKRVGGVDNSERGVWTITCIGPIVHWVAVTLAKSSCCVAWLIGIDPDGRVHVSERPLMVHDGPLLEESLKAIADRMMPRSSEHRPDRDRLAARFEQFKRLA